MRTNFRNVAIDYLRRRGLLVFIAICTLLLGIACGFLGVKMLSGDQATYLQDLLNNFWLRVRFIQVDANMYMHQQIGKILMVVGVIYLLGLTVIGLPLLVIPLFMYGFMIGFVSMFLVSYKGFAGSLFALVALGPQNIIYIPVLILAVVTAMEFSWSMVRKLWRAEPYPIFPKVIRYSGIMLLLSCVISLGGLVEVFVVHDLIKWLAIKIVSI